jgi:hypothetical protein
MQCLIWLNSNHVCGASGTIASVTKVPHLRNVSCCLAVYQERPQERFSWMDVRKLIEFHVLLGKSVLECYKLLKEGLRLHVTVCVFVNAIKNGWEETDDSPYKGAPTLVTNGYHVGQVKSVREHPVGVYLILTNSLGK